MANNAPAVQNGNDVASLINRQMPAIKMAMSGATEEERKKRAERFCRVALTAIRNNSSLMKADPTSLLGALMTSASLNLEIDPRGLAYLVPYKGEIQLQIGYKGLKELAYRTGKVKSIYDEVVYKNEIDAGNVQVTIGLERDLKHVIDVTNPDLREPSKDNPIVLAYAVAVLADDSKHFEFVDRGEVEKRKKASQSASGKNPQYSPWSTWEAEMWKKTAVKKLARALPQSTEYAEFQRAVALDEQADAGTKQHFETTIDIEPSKPRDINTSLDAAQEQPAESTGQQPPKLTCPTTGEEISALACVGCKDRDGCPAHE